MDRFLRASAFLFGVANALTYNLIGSSEDLLGDLTDSVPWPYIA